MHTTSSSMAYNDMSDIELSSPTSSLFDISCEALVQLNNVRPPPTPPPPHQYANPQARDAAGLRARGGLAWIAKALRTDLRRGIDVQPLVSDSHQHELLELEDASVPLAARTMEFGSNRLPEAAPKSLFALWTANLSDPIILLLIAAAAVCRTVLHIQNNIRKTRRRKKSMYVLIISCMHTTWPSRWARCCAS